MEISKIELNIEQHNKLMKMIKKYVNLINLYKLNEPLLLCESF